MINKKCKYYSIEDCSENCKKTWVKCDLCEEFFGWCGDDQEINGFRIVEVSETCCDNEWYETVMKICPKCYKEKILILKKESSNLIKS